MSDDVRVRINKRTGKVVIEGEGFEAAALKKSLENMGDVVERHIGAEHAHDTEVSKVHNHK